jgi:hypothetical protein
MTLNKKPRLCGALNMFEQTIATALQNPERVCMPPPRLIVLNFHFGANMRRIRYTGKIFF